MTPTTLMKQFLAGLRSTRTGHRSSAAATYWAAAEALGVGKEPTCKPAALAEALERLGKTEADLERDAHLLGEQAQAQSVAAKETAAVQRHKAAVGAKAAADQKAAALEEQARKLRTEAEAAVVEAGRELNGVRKATSRVAELSRELAKRQHPAHLQHADEMCGTGRWRRCRTTSPPPSAKSRRPRRPWRRGRRTCSTARWTRPWPVVLGARRGSWRWRGIGGTCWRSSWPTCAAVPVTTPPART